MPRKDEVSISQPLEIDGHYEMSNNVERKLKNTLGVVIDKIQKVRFTGGIAYYEDMGKLWQSPSIEPNKVFLKDIRKISPTVYEATFFPLNKDTTYNVTLLKEGNDLKMHMKLHGLVEVEATTNFELIEK